MGGKKRKVKKAIKTSLYKSKKEKTEVEKIIEEIKERERLREETIDDDWLEHNKLSRVQAIKLHKAQLLTNKWWFVVKDNWHSPWKEHIEKCYTETDWKVHKAIMNCRKCEGKGAKESTEQWKQSIGKDW